MYWQSIGFGFTVGWMWIFFLGGPVFAALLKSCPGIGDTHFQFFLFCTALSYLTVNQWSGASPLSSKKRLLLAGTFSMIISPVLIYLLLRYAVSSPLLSLWIYILDAVGAWGCAALMIGWQESFTGLSFRKTCLIYSGGVGIASLSLFLGALFDVKLGILLTVMQPVLSLLFLLKQKKSVLPVKKETFPLDTFRTDNRGSIYPVKLILLIILFYSAGGLMYKLVSLKYALSNLFWTSNISYMIVVALAGVIFYFIPNLDLRLLYRPVLPLLAAVSLSSHSSHASGQFYRF